MPIIPFFNDTYNNAFIDLVNSYGDVVHSHIYGHLHTDSFRLFMGQPGMKWTCIMFLLVKLDFIGTESNFLF